MNARPDWTRRRFLQGSAAATTLSFGPLPQSLAYARGLRAFTALDSHDTSSQDSRELGTPGPSRPPPEASTARPLRYTPVDRAFHIRNGLEFFNRPIYPPGSGTSSAFRIDAGDLPEFSLYLPGHGGNLRIGITRPAGSKWIFEAADIAATYLPGQMLYTIHDPLLGRGSIDLQLLAQATGAGLHLAVRARNTPPDLSLTWVFGGVSGQKGRRGGDLGCEIEPVSRFFQVHPEDCNRNSYILHASTADLESRAARLHLTFPPGARLHIAEAARWNEGWQALQQVTEDTTQPILVGSVPLDASAGSDLPTLHLLLRSLIPTPETAPQIAPDTSPGTSPGTNPDTSPGTSPGTSREPAAIPPPSELHPQPRHSTAADPDLALADRLAQLAELNGRFHITTPDPFLDAAASALVHAADALWDQSRQCLLEGAVASRSPAPGWRGPCALDALGSHDRMREHLRYWISRQNLTPLPASADPDATATGPADPGSDLTRKDALLHTLGDLPASPENSNGPKNNIRPDNMNLVFFDALVRHLRWTGDVDLAREIWPALTRHTDREYCLFRRTLPHPDPDAPPHLRTLPIYEAYACIPGGASLAGNGAGSTHASASNLFLNRSTATVARIIGEDPAPFDEEADLIAEGLRQLLWMPEVGAFAESRDTLLPQTQLTSPALWTASHAIDSEHPGPRQAWQIATDRLSSLRPITVHGPGVPVGDWFLLPSNDWLPSPRSRNAITLADNMHFALALWQAGMPTQAFNLFQGNLLDSMYQGLCPGNLHLTSQLDPHRGETVRDSGDAIGITARALVEGLFGILPDLLRATLTIRPGFPSTWNQAELHHPDIDLAWHRDGLSETLEITSRLPHPVALTLVLPARTTSDPVVLSNGLAFPFAFDPDATGSPRIILTNFPAATSWKIDIRWHGRAPLDPPAPIACIVGDPIPLPPSLVAGLPDRKLPDGKLPDRKLDDPQACLQNGVPALPGRHAVFLPIRQGSCRYWLPLQLDIRPATTYTVSIAPPAPEASTPSASAPATPGNFKPLDLSDLLDSKVGDILGRDYTAPRSPFCSLSLPLHLLGGPSDLAPTVDDTGLRSAGGTLLCPLPSANLPFLTPAGPSKPNCRLLSFWQQDRQRVEISLSGQARNLHLLMTGTTFPQASRTLHGIVTVLYTDGSTSVLNLRTPTTWWPIEQDYDFDRLLSPAPTSLPPRIDLRSGKTRLPDPAGVNGSGHLIPGGSATLLHLPLHPDRSLASLQVECTLYGIVLGLLAATLER